MRWLPCLPQAPPEKDDVVPCPSQAPLETDDVAHLPLAGATPAYPVGSPGVDDKARILMLTMSIGGGKIMEKLESAELRAAVPKKKALFFLYIMYYLSRIEVAKNLE